jgi:hypothetical protein
VAEALPAEEDLQMNPYGWHFTEITIVPPLAQCYRNVPRVGRVKTTKYKKWIETASTEISSPPDEPLSQCHVCLTLPYIANGDLDNRFKGTMDLLKSSGWIVDDNMKCVRKIEAIWSRDVPRQRMVISIKEVTDGDILSSPYPG